MSDFGFKDHRIDSVGNVIGSIGTGPKKLLFDSHLDHVPPGMMINPYSGKVMDGERFGVRGKVMYGRGACDTKSSVCSMLMACKALIDLDIKLDGNLTFAGVVREESGGSLGTKNLIAGQTFDAAIIGEPSDLNIAIGQRGGAFLYLDVKGLSGHVAQAEHCVNSFEKSIDVVDCVRKKVEPRLRKNKKLGTPCLSFTHAKVQPGFVSIIPDRTIINFDFRYNLKYMPDHLISDIRHCIKKMESTDPKLNAKVDYMTNKYDHHEYKEDIPPFYTNPNGPEVNIVKSAVRDVLGYSPHSILWPFATDGGFVAKKKIITIGLGPGDISFVHGVNEHVKLESVIAASKIYALLAVKMLGVA